MNDSARAMMARLAEFRDDESGLLVTTGSSTAYLLTTNQGLSTIPNDGQLIAFSPHVASGAAATLQVDGGTVYPIQTAPGGSVSAGALSLGAPYAAKFSLANLSWILVGVYGNQLGATWVVAGGTSDVITATYSPAITALVDGQICFFRAAAANATATPTFSPNGLTAEVITKDGGVALFPDDIPGNLAEVILRYNLAHTRWELLNPAQTAPTVTAPQGYMTPVSNANAPVPVGDFVGIIGIYYSPYVGNQLPIYNGSSFSMFTFAQLSLELSSGSQASNGLYDVFAFLDSGVVTLAFGPSWGAGTGGNQTAGSCARGTGAGGTALAKINGLWTNAVALSAANNSTTTYAIPANQGTYLGTIHVDATAGQVTCHVTWGQNRKRGVWNAYNRVPVVLQVGDSTASWSVAGITSLRASNGAPAAWTSAAYNVGSGTVCNGMTVLCGLVEEPLSLGFQQAVTTAGSGGFEGEIGIGPNTVTAAAGFTPTFGGNNNNAVASARLDGIPSIGINTYQALERELSSSPTNVTMFGTQPNMMLTAQYRA